MLFWSFTSQLWQPSTKHMADVRKRVAQLPCCLFFCPKKRVSRIVLLDTPGRPVRFCAKNTKFLTSSPKKNVQTCKVQEEDLLSPKCQNVPLAVLTSGLETLTNIYAESSDLFIPLSFFAFLSKKRLLQTAFLDKYIAVWINSFFLLDKKRTSVNSHVIKILQKFQKNQFTSKCTLERLKRVLK